MNNTDYAFAVASIRAAEQTLLTAEDVERILSANDYSEAVRYLNDKGWDIPENPADDFSSALNNELLEAWQNIADVLPDRHELDFLIIRNDFHNLKAALKGLFTTNGDISSECFIAPSVYDAEEISAAVHSNKFDELPEILRSAAETAYELLTKTSDGQLADTEIDRISLETMNKLAAETGNKDFIKLAELYTATTDLIVALRCARTKKNERFILAALCDCSTLNLPELVRATSRGVDEVTDYISKSPYNDAADTIGISDSTFEKWCDDLILAAVDEQRLSAFGPGPLATYWIAKSAEIKTVRIILAARHIGLDREEITGRMRELYV